MDVKNLLKKDIKIKVHPLFLLMVGAIVLFMVQINNLRDVYGPTIINDELGYWGAAAYFNGVDWGETMADVPYYAYGYGFILAPVFALVKSPVMMYKIAVIINDIMVVACLFIAYHMLLALAENADKKILVIIAFASVFTTNNIYQSQITWAESLLLLLTWIIADILAYLLKNPTNKKIISLGVVSSFIFFVHQRTIGITAVVFVFIICMVISKKISFKQMVSFFVVCFLVFVLGFIIKHKIQSELYIVKTPTKVNVNDFGGVKQRIFGYFKACISGENSITELLAGFAGKIFYFGVASYMLLYFSLFYIAKGFRKFIKTKKCDIRYLMLLIALLFLAAEITITAVYMIGCYRNDGIFYGRYAEIALGPVLAITLLLLNEEGIKCKYYIAVGVTGLMLQYIFVIWPQQTLWIEYGDFWDTTVPVLTELFWGNGVMLEKTLRLLFVLILLYCLFACKKRYLGNLSIIVMIIFTILNFEELVFLDRTHHEQTKLYIETYTDTIEKYGEENVYCYMENGDFSNHFFGAILQYGAKENIIKYAYLDDIKDNTYENPVYLVYYTSKEFKYFIENFEAISNDTGEKIEEFYEAFSDVPLEPVYIFK